MMGAGIERRYDVTNEKIYKFRFQGLRTRFYPTTLTWDELPRGPLHSDGRVE